MDLSDHDNTAIACADSSRGLSDRRPRLGPPEYPFVALAQTSPGRYRDCMRGNSEPPCTPTIDPGSSRRRSQFLTPAGERTFVNLDDSEESLLALENPNSLVLSKFSEIGAMCDLERVTRLPSQEVGRTIQATTIRSREIKRPELPRWVRRGAP